MCIAYFLHVNSSKTQPDCYLFKTKCRRFTGLEEVQKRAVGDVIKSMEVFEESETEVEANYVKVEKRRNPKNKRRW